MVVAVETCTCMVVAGETCRCKSEGVATCRCKWAAAAAETCRDTGSGAVGKYSGKEGAWAQAWAWASRTPCKESSGHRRRA